jgi:hypothetical protein
MRRGDAMPVNTAKKEEWDKIHLHHASLHMSFIVPQ